MFGNGVTVRGAYGRKYNSAAAALADWKKGMDFQIVNGPYISIGEAEVQDLSVTIRYANDKKSVVAR